MEGKVLIFIQDLGVYGCIVVAAETEGEAREMMARCNNYEESRVVTSTTMPTSARLIHCNMGDS